MKPAFAVVFVVGVFGCGHPPAKPQAPAPTPSADRAPAPAATDPAPGEVDVVADGLVLPPVRFEAGQRFTLVEDFHIMAVAELGGSSIRLDRHQDSETTAEVLEVDAEGESVRDRVTFAIDERRDTMNRKTQRTTSPIVGKTYVIAHAGDVVTVTDEGGRTPPRAEVEAVRAWGNKSAGEEVLDRMFDGRRWFYGERIQLGAAALEAFNRTVGDPQTRYTAFSQELREVAKGVAVFRVLVRWDQHSEGGVLTFELAGIHEYDVASGRQIRGSLRGPVKGTLSGAAVNGEATMTTHVK